MNRRKLVKLLTNKGFILQRIGKHATFVKDGVQIQVPSSGKELNWRLQKSIMIQLRKMKGSNHYEHQATA